MGHIPQSPTAGLTLERFAPALEEALKPGLEYDVDRWLYVPNHYGEYRYILGTRGKNPLICIGINPSTAAPDHLDNTLKSVERIALANGFDSFIMFNVYPQRATRPQDMERDCNAALHAQNMEAFEYICGLSAHPTVWAAWGAVIEQRPYLKDCVREMIAIGQNHGARWVKAGPVSKKGHPHHPLYLKKDTPVEPFDLPGYLDTLE